MQMAEQEDMPPLQEINQSEYENKEKDVVAEVRKIIDTLE